MAINEPIKPDAVTPVPGQSTMDNEKPFSYLWHSFFGSKMYSLICNVTSSRSPEF